MIRSRRRCPLIRLFEPLDLLRQLLLVEEDGRVGQVDHELRGVLQLDEEVFDVARLFVHHGSTPDVLMTRRMRRHAGEVQERRDEGNALVVGVDAEARR